MKILETNDEIAAAEKAVRESEALYKLSLIHIYGRGEYEVWIGVPLTQLHNFLESVNPYMSHKIFPKFSNISKLFYMQKIAILVSLRIFFFRFSLSSSLYLFSTTSDFRRRIMGC